jgi:hypothetical protein
MSTLTGQAIKDTYEGLLKLADSTTGITSTIQTIQDGLGNNTGMRVATNFFQSPTTLGINYLKGDYYGLGFGAANTGAIANTQNVIIAAAFYDTGLYDYSAITYNIGVATTTSDVWTGAFYTAQFAPNIGLGPSILIQSGITFTTNSTGVKTTTLPSTLSFSGYGPGIYFFVFKIANAGATPTVSPKTAAFTTFATSLNPFTSFGPIGMTLSQSGALINSPYKVNTQNTSVVYSSLSNFQTSYSTSDISSPSTTVSAPQWGWALKTI